MHVVGFLNPVSPETYAFNVSAYPRLPALAAELAALKSLLHRICHESRQLHRESGGGGGDGGRSALSREAFVVKARKPDEIAAALAEVMRLKADSLVAASDPLVPDRRGEIIAFGRSNGLPVVGFTCQGPLCAPLPRR